MVKMKLWLCQQWHKNKILGSFILLDSPTQWQWTFQDPASTTMERIIDLHNDIMVFLVLIITFVLWILIKIVEHFNSNNHKTMRFKFQHHTNIERIWTYIPTIILVLIATPSFSLLYTIDELHEPQMTLKIIGHQWYWSYEYSDFITDTIEESVMFDSYMQAEDELVIGSYRLLEVDNRVILPAERPIRLLITSSDVLHSWAIPSFGVKMDASPGRLNQVALYITRTGIYYGQCSELCGVNHAYMPITIEALDINSPQMLMLMISQCKLMRNFKILPWKIRRYIHGEKKDSSENKLTNPVKSIPISTDSPLKRPRGRPRKYEKGESKGKNKPKNPVESAPTRPKLQDVMDEKAFNELVTKMKRHGHTVDDLYSSPPISSEPPPKRPRGRPRRSAKEFNDHIKKLFEEKKQGDINDKEENNKKNKPKNLVKSISMPAKRLKLSDIQKEKEKKYYRLLKKVWKEIKSIPLPSDPLESEPFPTMSEKELYDFLNQPELLEPEYLPTESEKEYYDFLNQVWEKIESIPLSGPLRKRPRGRPKNSKKKNYAFLKEVLKEIKRENKNIMRALRRRWKQENEEIHTILTRLHEKIELAKKKRHKINKEKKKKLKNPAASVPILSKFQEFEDVETKNEKAHDTLTILHDEIEQEQKNKLKNSVKSIPRSSNLREPTDMEWEDDSEYRQVDDRNWGVDEWQDRWDELERQEGEYGDIDDFDENDPK